MTAPWLDDGDVQLYHGDVITTLRSLPAGLVQTVVTSPPYWGLRDYGTGQWSGGDADCDHTPPRREHGVYTNGQGQAYQSSNTSWDAPHASYKQTCPRCGARRVDSQLGLEATPDAYVERMVAVFREVWRVLRDDGTVWLNLGDSYVSNPGSGYARGDLGGLAGADSPRYQETMRQAHGASDTTAPRREYGLKPKDLVGIPWRVAFALQTDGWYLRSDIVWSKPNPMPESVTDRPTKAHEMLFLLSKRPRYFYDADAIREPPETERFMVSRNEYEAKRNGSFTDHSADLEQGMHQPKRDGFAAMSHPAGRNRRSVWTIATEPFPEAHFATYPQELVRPCILAGTSERGECSACGAPWVREVETTYTPLGDPERQNRERLARQRIDHRNYEAEVNGGPQSMSHGRASKQVETTGWRASCSCGAPTRPQTVLDPFIGSGTTALVARKHGRRCIGIDLSAEYLAIAARRLQQLSLFAEAATIPPTLEAPS